MIRLWKSRKIVNSGEESGRDASGQHNDCRGEQRIETSKIPCLFPVPEDATKSEDSRRPLWETELDEIIRRSPISISENSLFNTLFRNHRSALPHV